MYMKAMAGLRAQEGLFLSTAVALGTRNLKPAHAQLVRSGWLRAMRPEPTVQGALSTIGIKVVRSDKRKPGTSST